HLAARAALHVLGPGRSAHLLDGPNLVRIRLDTPVGNQETEELPVGTPNTHFSGLSIMRVRRRLRNVSSRSSIRDARLLVLTTRLSTYASTFRPNCEWRVYCTPHW